MRSDQPTLFISTYTPLVGSTAGREASVRFKLPPFIDGSIRREPDLQNPLPSISCLCRGNKFAPRLRPDDVVVYMTRRGRFGSRQKQRRLTAILRVIRLFESHAEAAAWYFGKGLPLPSNCMVANNPPMPLNQSHRKNDNKTAGSEAAFLRRWDMGYRLRARACGRFVTCTPLSIMLDQDAPVVHDEDLRKVFGKVPATQNPGKLPIDLLTPLLERLALQPALPSRP